MLAFKKESRLNGNAGGGALGSHWKGGQAHAATVGIAKNSDGNACSLGRKRA